MVIPGGVPVIVPKELYGRVQVRLEKNRHAPARAKAEEEYLLTNKLFCGRCQRMMVGESGTSHTGQVYYYYKCNSAKQNKGCKKKAVRKDWLENEVVQLIRQYVLTDEEIAQIAKMVVEYQKNENTALDFLRHFQHGDVNDINYRRQLIDCFVNRIFLYDDHMVLTFNTSNNTKEISFDLVEGSDMVEGPPS